LPQDNFLFCTRQLALPYYPLVFSFILYPVEILSLAHHSPFIASGLSSNVHQFHRQRLQDAGATVEQYPHAMEFYHLDPKALEERLDK